jgi:hypothetical protein
MSTTTLQSLPKLSDEAKRKRLEIRRCYKYSVDNIENGEFMIIPHTDPRLNYLSRWGQDLIVEINSLVKSECEHIDGNRYAVTDEEVVEEIEEKTELLFTSIDGTNSSRDMLRVLLFASLIVLVLIASGELLPLLELLN